FCVERLASAVSQVHNLMPDASGDQPVSLSARHTLRQIFQLLDLEKTADASANFTVLDDRRAFRHRFIRAVKKHRQDSDARVQCQISNDGFEISHDSRHRARALGEDERVVTTIEKRLRMTKRLP